ncbi:MULTISPECIES: hypothetical protein [unclassified Agarivorans]|uniref:hypothetical protein n=1 Tax=unclassified Agarivorans TaxID=2636026 RepID=UPI0010E2A884|nr:MULTISPECIES: hypothetical protein [unclassified Agarivorans]MDO6686147.1 hypothetical protein [Agarivorans sp. 3_MG-2023]MDO6716404.1 hypothetical protein [Agarivorans sp. 2_MG-2023]MDO6764677.1 hypothetical protein [Agarivorans sp. 1_MG-2023]GDY24273.1 hypothetical protein AHAT_01630 [Agarivorans sp. Toyoura001]
MRKIVLAFASLLFISTSHAELANLPSQLSIENVKEVKQGLLVAVLPAPSINSCPASQGGLYLLSEHPQFEEYSLLLTQLAGSGKKVKLEAQTRQYNSFCDISTITPVP